MNLAPDANGPHDIAIEQPAKGGPVLRVWRGGKFVRGPEPKGGAGAAGSMRRGGAGAAPQTARRRPAPAAGT